MQNTPLEEKKIAPMSSVFAAYWQYAKKYPWLLFGVIGGTITLQAADLAAPLFLREFFNLLSFNKPSAAVAHSLFILLAFVAAMWLIDWASTRVQSACNEHLEAHAMEHIYADAFHYLLGHSYNFFISNFAGSLTQKVARFARSFETLFDAMMTQFFPTFLFVIGAIVILFLRSHMLGTILAVCSLLLLLFQIYLSKLRQPIRAKRAAADSRVTGALADAIGNQSTIALFSGAVHERNIFADVVGHWHEATLRSWESDSWTWGALNFFMVIIQIVLLGGAVYYWTKGVLTIGDFVLIQSYLLATFSRLSSINFQLRRFYDGLADAGEMVAILDIPHEVKDIPNAPNLAIENATIEFRDVGFFFRESRAVLDHFNLKIQSGEKVALVGPSGAGKTTITKLLLRLYDVSSGEILIDGKNSANVTQDSLRDAISFVPQEPILFHRTLMENIRYGRRDATDAEVFEAARLAHCDEFIAELPEGYETFVGERGIKLSGGERQRVAIARAILKNAPILVLDEATSSLDSESEHLIQDALEVLMRGKTVIVIAHRLSTIMKMDRIVVLDGGKIVDAGTHDELLARGGLYQKLWSIQAGGFLKDEDEEENSVEENNSEIIDESDQENIEKELDNLSDAGRTS